MDPKDVKREARKQRALERLGTSTPRCVVCGCTDWRCLEAHHVGGRKFDSATVILCRNCHRIATDEQKDAPPLLGGEPSLSERAGHFLKGLAALFSLLIAKLNELADALLEDAARQAARAAGGAK